MNKLTKNDIILYTSVIVMILSYLFMEKIELLEWFFVLSVGISGFIMGKEFLNFIGVYDG